MSRGFLGSGGSGNSKRPGAAKSDPTKKKDPMAALQFSRKRNKTMNELIRERTGSQVKDYKEMIQDKLDEKMASGSRANFFNLPGTVAPEEKEMTKGRQMAIDAFKMRNAKKRLKVREQKVDVIPKNYGNGGWIDKKGKIRNKNGDIVMEVNLNTGQISDRLGMKVGKYNGASMSGDFKIQRLIDKYTASKGQFNPFAPKE